MEDSVPKEAVQEEVLVGQRRHILLAQKNLRAEHTVAVADTTSIKTQKLSSIMQGHFVV